MTEQKVLLKATIVFIMRNYTEVLLPLKVRKISKGKRNGLGGGIKKGETAEKAAAREVKEEAGLIVKPKDLAKVAIVDFLNHKDDGTSFTCHCHVYMAFKWSGEIKLNKEFIDPKWYNRTNLPLDNMMLADRFWVPPALNSYKIRALAEYGPNQETLIGTPRVEFVDVLQED